MLNLLVALSMMLSKTEPDFNIARGYGIDPNFAKAVAIVESGWGHDSKMAIRDNNIFGMHKKKFKSVNDGIHYFCRLIKKNYPKGIENIAKKYCPPNYKAWADKVRYLMRYLMRYLE